MAHHIYSTEACVINLKPYGEGNAITSLVTKDLGLIRAYAQGIRLGKSKLRMSIQECSKAQVSLVKGKDVWRLTNAYGAELFFPIFKKNSKNLEIERMVFSIHALLLRMVPENEMHPSLFFIIEGLWKSVSNVSVKYYKSLECIALLNILHELGYVGEENLWKDFIGIFSPSLDQLSKMIPLIPNAVKTINNSLEVSHL